MRAHALIASLVVLAGCVTPAVTDAGTADAAPAATLVDCWGIESYSTVTAEEAAALTPVPLTPAEGSVFFVTAVECASHAESDASTVGVFWAGIQVAPPEGAPDADFHGYLLGSVHTHEAVARAFTAMRQVQASAGDFRATGFQGPLSEAVADGHTLTVTANVPLDGVPLLDARFYAVEGGNLTGAMQLHAHDHGLILGAGRAEGASGAFFGTPAPRLIEPIGLRAPIREMAFTWLACGDEGAPC